MAKKTNTNINGTDYFRVRATIGIKDGKPIRKAFYGESKKEAEKNRDDYLRGSGSGILNYDKIIFGEYYEEWFDIIYKPKLKQSSYNRFESLSRIWIKSAPFYKMPIVAINSLHIQKHLNSIESRTTSEMVYFLVNRFFKYCLIERIVTYSPMLSASIPANNKISDKSPLTNKEIAILLNAYSKDPSLFVFVFDMFTGLRQGELLALKRNDIDLKSNMIHVNKSLNRVSYQVDGRNKSHIEINTPKNVYSVRDVPIMKELLPMLKDHMLREKEKYFKVKGLKISDDDFLFSSNTCAPLRGDRLTLRWHDVQNSLGIHDINFHYLRHTFCTLLARKKIPIKTASILMGHSNIQTTAKIYTHVDIEDQEAAISSLSSYFKRG